MKVGWTSLRLLWCSRLIHLLDNSTSRDKNFKRHRQCDFEQTPFGPSPNISRFFRSVICWRISIAIDWIKRYSTLLPGSQSTHKIACPRRIKMSNKIFASTRFQLLQVRANGFCCEIYCATIDDKLDNLLLTGFCAVSFYDLWCFHWIT